MKMTNVRINGWIDGKIVGFFRCVDKYMDGWMDEKMDR